MIVKKDGLLCMIWEIQKSISFNIEFHFLSWAPSKQSTVFQGKRQHAIIATWQILSSLHFRPPTQVLSEFHLPLCRPTLHLRVLHASTLNCIYSNDSRQIDYIPNSFFFCCHLNGMQPANAPYTALPTFLFCRGKAVDHSVFQRQGNEVLLNSGVRVRRGGVEGGIMSANQRAGDGRPVCVRETMSNPS